ncbi:MAG TPA: hypothetical protein VGB13_05610 [Candidatus Krumholzibacteria bacterium]
MSHVAFDALPERWSLAIGVGSESKPPLPDVRRAEVLGSRHARRTHDEAHCSKVSNGSSKSSPVDVLEEDSCGLAVADDPGDLGPDSALVGVSASLAGEAVGLAREARSDEIHDATPRLAIEGSEIRPDRRMIQSTRFALRDQDVDAESFPLHVTDRAKVSDHELESEGDPADPGT